ncbi:MAG: Rpn family recombination-promoting nuclease/putative transposase [Muribaculaceae bacterium]|nr:Rpn family recombination-promoting nuclease/putative transposase [Muribaculaceae bacterium]
MTDEDKLVRFDWAIKRLLRHKADHTILNGFLTSLLGRQIRIERMLESEGNKEYEENKSNRVDMLAEDADGKKIIIEVQNETEDSYFHRMLFGVSKTVNEYLESGKGYGEVAKVYSINIVYFKLGEGSDYAYHGKTEFRGMHDGDLLNLSPKLQEKFRMHNVYEIFPEYYILKANDFNRLAKTPLEQWMHFLRHSKLPEGADAPGLLEASKELQIARLTKEQRRDYERYIDNMRSLEDVVSSAWSSGHFEGRAEGRAEGKWESAKAMAKDGMSLEKISLYTGIPIEELKNNL